MKKIIFTFFVFLLIIQTNACEICGCGVGNYYIGLLPQFNHRFIGLRYHFNSFRTRLHDDPTQFSNDFYQTIELWGGMNIGKKFQVLTFIPFNFNHQVSDEGTVNRNGLGDIAILANYKAIDVSKGNVSQQFWIGGGVKLPTGRFTIEANDPDVASVANTQVGSGSADFLLNAMYNVHVNKLGIVTSANYKINTSNNEDYKFGNKFSASSFVYYALPASHVTVSPNIGLLYEQTGHSELNSNKIDLTGGKILQGSIGAEISFTKLSVGFNTQLPIAQNFAENQTKSKIKGMVHVSFAF